MQISLSVLQSGDIWSHILPPYTSFYLPFSLTTVPVQVSVLTCYMFSFP